MKIRMNWALPLAFMFATFPAFATSVNEYEKTTPEQGAKLVHAAIDKIVDDVAKVKPDLSKAIHDYFYVVPDGKPNSPGIIAFGTELIVVEEGAKKGKYDLDKVQIEGVLLEVIKQDVLSKQNAVNNPPRSNPEVSAARPSY